MGGYNQQGYNQRMPANYQNYQNSGQMTNFNNQQQYPTNTGFPTGYNNQQAAFQQQPFPNQGYPNQQGYPGI